MKKNSSSNIGAFLGIFFTIFGAVFFLIGIIVFIRTNDFISNGVEVDAEISDIHSFAGSNRHKHDVYVDFEYEGVEYKDVYLNVYIQGMHEGEEIEIICDPDDPYNITIKSASTLFLVIFSGVGGVFLIIGISMLAFHLIRKGKVKYLLENGMKISGVITDMSRDMRFEINGVHPYRIYCEYNDSSKNLLYKFKSDLLSFNPNNCYKVGDPIDIYVDPNNWKKNYVNAVDRFADRTVDFT